MTVKEPERTAEKRFNEYGAERAAARRRHHVPRAARGERRRRRAARRRVDPLGAASRRGSTSRSSTSSRWRRARGSDADLREDAGLFSLRAMLASGKKPEEAERALLAELKRMQDAPVTKPSSTRPTTSSSPTQLRERETNNGKALAIGNAAVLLGDASRVNTDIERLQAVTAADVQRVMKKYFTDTNRVVITYLPESDETVRQCCEHEQSTTRREQNESAFDRCDA